MAHTPGPWEWRDGALRAPTSSAMIATVLNDEGCTVYRDSPVDEFTAEIEKNKALIAAAPELLAALKSLVAYIADTDDEGLAEHSESMIAARQAIAKAEAA